MRYNHVTVTRMETTGLLWKLEEFNSCGKCSLPSGGFRVEVGNGAVR